MILDDVIEAARYSELSSLAIKNDNKAIVAFLNLGMLELYKRFPIKTGESLVPLVAGVSTYDLPDDFMYALSVHGNTADDPDETIELPINKDSSDISVFFPSYDQIQVPDTIVSASVSVIYVAKPERYSSDNMSIELDLPETLIEPLLHYIGYKGHLGIKGDAQAENNAHYLRFDRSCQKAKELGVAFPADSWDMPERLNDRGFA